MPNKEILEETQEILINCIETLREINEETFDEKIEFVKKALSHLNNNVIKDKDVEYSNGVNRLLKKIKRNSTILSSVALTCVNNKNILYKKEMIINWLAYYAKQLDTFF